MEQIYQKIEIALQYTVAQKNFLLQVLQNYWPEITRYIEIKKQFKIELNDKLLQLISIRNPNPQNLQIELFNNQLFSNLRQETINYFNQLLQFNYIDHAKDDSSSSNLNERFLNIPRLSKLICLKCMKIGLNCHKDQQIDSKILEQQIAGQLQAIENNPIIKLYYKIKNVFIFNSKTAKLNDKQCFELSLLYLKVVDQFQEIEKLLQNIDLNRFQQIQRQEKMDGYLEFKQQIHQCQLKTKKEYIDVDNIVNDSQLIDQKQEKFDQQRIGNNNVNFKNDNDSWDSEEFQMDEQAEIFISTPNKQIQQLLSLTTRNTQEDLKLKQLLAIPPNQINIKSLFCRFL